jgi:hypothetical protein
MAATTKNWLLSVIAFAYGLFTLILYLLVAIKDGSFFRRPTEKEKLELQLGNFAIYNTYDVIPCLVSSHLILSC